MSAAAAQRLPLIDALRAVASQLIVLHHLAFYGPMSDHAHQLAPALLEWLADEARMAVQVFLVISGFMAAKVLAPEGELRALSPWRLVVSRYIKITLPYTAALLVAMVCTELARRWLHHDSLPDPPELMQFLMHALLLHGVLGYDSLSAGVWYVAIDFQLFALFVGLMWMSRWLQHRHLGAKFSVPSPVGDLPQAALARHAARWRTLRWAAVLVPMGLVSMASLFHFNRHTEWDNWAPYFFGSYALGVLCYWASRPTARKPAWQLVWAGVVLLTGAALALDFRGRLALALAVAGLLMAAQRGGWIRRWPRSRLLAYLGQISYSVFLLNFPVALVVNALFTHFAPPDPWVQSGGVVVAWLACTAAGALFHHAIELPLRKLG